MPFFMLVAILLAGGKSSRMNLSTPKPFLKLKQKAVYAYSLERLIRQKEILKTVVVAPKEFHDQIGHDFPESLLAEPGEDRLGSILEGFKKVQNSDCSHLLIHDAARPFTQENEIKALIYRGLKIDGIALAEKISSTIKKVENHKIIETIDRENHYLMQTPQIIKKSLFIEACKKVQDQKISITDDMQLLEVIGKSGEILLGSRYNFKLTYPEDLAYAEFLIEKVLP